MKSRIMEIFGTMLAIRATMAVTGVREDQTILASTLEKAIEGMSNTAREDEVVVNGRKFLSVRMSIPEDALARLETAFKEERIL